MPANRTHSNPHWNPRPDFERRVPVKAAKPPKFRFTNVEGLADFILHDADLPEVTVYDAKHRQAVALDIAAALFKPKYAKGKADARKVVQAYIDTGSEQSLQERARQQSLEEVSETDIMAATLSILPHQEPGVQTVYVGFQQLPDGSTAAFRGDSQPSRVSA